MSSSSHIHSSGEAHMVDVENKAPTSRRATAHAVVQLNSEAFETLCADSADKGNVLTVAKIAGIQAAKKTADLIPLCHPIPLEHVEIRFELDSVKQTVDILCTAAGTARTGVEMEALTGCAVTALTVYDMLKSVQKDITISGIRLLHKKGGVSGEYRCKDFSDFHIIEEGR